MSPTPRTRSRQARRLVVAACRRETPDDVLERLAADVDADTFLDAVEYHRVAPTVLRRLDGIETLPTPARHDLQALDSQAQASRLHSMRALRALAGALAEPFLVVKGPVLSSHWYPDSAAREYGDVDVLVRPHDFESAIEALTIAGFRVLTTNWHGFLDHRVAEIPLRYESSIIDLHWDLVAMGITRDDITLRPSAVFERATEIRIGEVDVLTLDPVDTLLHVCVNTGIDGARRLRGLLDIDVLVRSGHVDLDELARRSQAAGAHRLTATVLQRTRTMLATPLPDGLLRAILPARSWLVANDIVDRIGKGSQGHQDGVASGVLVAAARPDVTTTARALGRGLRDAASQRTGRPALTSPGGPLDWQRSPEEGQLTAARRRYLDFVGDVESTIDRRRCDDADELHRRLADLQPRTTPMLGAALLGGLRGRRHRADLFEFGDGRLAAVVLRYRWTIGRTTAYPLILDEAAASIVGRFLERTATTDLSGMESDTEPLAPFLPRWRSVTSATVASLPPGFIWPDDSPGVREATIDDLEPLVDAFWRHAPHGYANRWLLRQRLRRAIDQLVLVVEEGNPPRAAGFGVLDSTTPEYDYWAQVVILPDHRQRGLSWDIVAAGASRAANRSRGAMVCVVETNPMSIPDDATGAEGWSYVALRPPRRFRGEARLRGWLDRLLALPTRAADEPVAAEVSYRTPGSADDVVTERRTQRWWRTQSSPRTTRDEDGTPKVPRPR